MHIERTGNEPIRRSAPAAGADAQLVLRNHRTGRRQTVRPDDAAASRGAELDVPAPGCAQPLSRSEFDAVRTPRLLRSLHHRRLLRELATAPSMPVAPPY